MLKLFPFPDDWLPDVVSFTEGNVAAPLEFTLSLVLGDCAGPLVCSDPPVLGAGSTGVWAGADGAASGWLVAGWVTAGAAGC